jgi:hypothetical protein
MQQQPLRFQRTHVEEPSLFLPQTTMQLSAIEEAGEGGKADFLRHSSPQTSSSHAGIPIVYLPSGPLNALQFPVYWYMYELPFGKAMRALYVCGDFPCHGVGMQ